MKKVSKSTIYYRKNRIRLQKLHRAYRKKNASKIRKYMKLYQRRNRRKIKELKKLYRAKNKKKISSYSKERYQKKKQMIRNIYLKHEFGITLVDYDAMLHRQHGRCFLCNGTNKGRHPRKLAVDHDHITGKVRALLCRGCNVGIGNLKDDPELLERAASYIRENKV